MLGSFGLTEILVVMFAFILLFGSKKIPEFARGIGTGIKEFKKSINDVKEGIKVESDKLIS